jgi:hypothetical protein
VLKFKYLQAIYSRGAHFRRHCGPCASNSPLEFGLALLYLLAETEIADLKDAIMKHDIGRFEITVDDVVLVKFLG